MLYKTRKCFQYPWSWVSWETGLSLWRKEKAVLESEELASSHPSPIPFLVIMGINRGTIKELVML